MRVIAETTELPTRFARIVVTDDQGRYVIPDLPSANYQVWVRGYGLVDSPKVRAKPGQQLNLTAVPAPDERAAAHYYPAIYWYAMMKLPPEKDFGGSTDIPKNITRDTWRQRMGNVDCIGCHQLGQESTRTVPAQFGEFKTGAEAWTRRVASGQTGEFMMNHCRTARQRAVQVFRRLDRPRRQGRAAQEQAAAAAGRRTQHRRHVVGVGHREAVYPRPDLLDRRNPTVNAYGPLYGSPEYSSDDMPILDPKTHKATFFKMPVADPNAPIVRASVPCLGRREADPALRLLGRRENLSQRANNHNGMFEAGPGGSPRPCVGSKIQLSAKGIGPSLGQGVPARPLRAPSVDARSQDDEVQLHRHLLRHSPSAVRLRRRRHALALGTGPVAGWVNTKTWDETGDAAKAQGWAPFVLDTNGNGKVDEWAEPDQPADAGKDKRIAGSVPTP